MSDFRVRQSIGFRFAIRIDSIHLANRFGSPNIGNPPKHRNVRFYCTGCWHLSAKPPIDGLPQLTRQSRSRHTSACHHSSPIMAYFAREGACPQPIAAASLPPPGLLPCVGESNRTNRFESIFWRESNGIEIIFGESKCYSQWRRQTRGVRTPCHENS